MRELLIDFNSENPLSGGDEAGYIGENNATQLVIKPSDEILGSKSKFFVAVFLTDGKIYRSEQFEPAQEIRIMLGAHLTQDYYLNVQLEGYSEENMLIYKSPMVTKIRFMPSIEGKECTEDIAEYTLKGNIELNRNHRHSHENSEVIKNLDESGGNLTYKGVPVSSQKNKKVVVLLNENGEADCTTLSSNTQGFKIISWHGYETFPIPADSEILSVEIQVADSRFPEWIDLRDMNNYISGEIDNTYILNCHKLFYNDDLCALIIATVNFIGPPNAVYNCISANLFRKARITYIENQES